MGMSGGDQTCQNNFPTCQNDFPTCQNTFPTCPAKIMFPLVKIISPLVKIIFPPAKIIFPPAKIIFPPDKIISLTRGPQGNSLQKIQKKKTSLTQGPERPFRCLDLFHHHHRRMQGPGGEPGPCPKLMYCKLLLGFVLFLISLSSSSFPLSSSSSLMRAVGTRSPHLLPIPFGWSFQTKHKNRMLAMVFDR